ncbi:MAG: DUF4404 family protein [Burkholderiales bacterium]|nr:DUF4404 family protein [Burkholderiales bacterium]
MKARLAWIAERIDDASLRERLLVFLAAVGALWLLAQLVFFNPIDQANRSRQEAIRGLQQELESLQKQLERTLAERGTDAEKRARENVAALRRELAELGRRFAEEQRTFTPPERMREVLERMLEPHPRVALIEFKTLAPQPIAAGDPKAERPEAYRHGVEFVLRGRYLDLYGYLVALEALPSRVYWGKVELKASDYPVHTLRVTLYTLSFDRAWLTV